MELGRKEREAISFGPVPLGGDSEEKGDYTGRYPPWGISSLSHTLGAQVLGTDTRKMSPWLIGGLVVLTEGLWETWSPFMRNTYKLDCSQSKAERED